MEPLFRPRQPGVHVLDQRSPRLARQSRAELQRLHPLHADGAWVGLKERGRLRNIGGTAFTLSAKNSAAKHSSLWWFRCLGETARPKCVRVHIPCKKSCHRCVTFTTSSITRRKQSGYESLNSGRRWWWKLAPTRAAIS